MATKSFSFTAKILNTGFSSSYFTFLFPFVFRLTDVRMASNSTSQVENILRKFQVSPVAKSQAHFQVGIFSSWQHIVLLDCFTFQLLNAFIPSFYELVSHESVSQAFSSVFLDSLSQLHFWALFLSHIIYSWYCIAFFFLIQFSSQS